jgi:Tol biopolymer transport system component
MSPVRSLQEQPGAVPLSCNGSQRRLLIAGGLEFGPQWSPTGDRVAFTVRTAQDEFDLRVVDVASGRVMQLASVRGVGASFLVGFSPEGDRILYWTADQDDVPSLWSVNTDGSHAQLRVTGSGWGDWQWLSAGP